MLQIEFPQIFRVRQNFVSRRINDLEGAIRAAFARAAIPQRVARGQTVAVTGGSRGIANYARIMRAVIRYFQELGAEPFIVPAMGSHGGGTAEGQREVLARYRITPETMGCPVRATMETTIVGQAPEGFDVHFDRYAAQADHVVVVNRVKPHTQFTGALESGLMKMLLIGLGKHHGAEIYHRAVEDYGFDRIVRSVGRMVLTRCRILCGLALVEDAFDETALVEALLPDQFETREPQLLALAKDWMPRIPFDDAHLLIIDRLGKDISGAGIDTNVIGRKYHYHHAADTERPRIRHICVRGLTEATHGNAIGIGFAEFCRTEVIQQMDFHATRINALTAGHVAAGMLPFDYPTDREMLTHALANIGLTPPPRSRLMWIADTSHLSELECSAAYWDEAQARQDLDVLTACRPLPFDAAGNLPSVQELAANRP